MRFVRELGEFNTVSAVTGKPQQRRVVILQRDDGYFTFAEEYFYISEYEGEIAEIRLPLVIASVRTDVPKFIGAPPPLPWIKPGSLARGAHSPARSTASAWTAQPSTCVGAR